MAVINSVLGPLDTSNLGFTLMHEHIMVSSAGTYRDYPELLGPNIMERAVDGLVKAREGGVNTIVDATTLDLGRDIEFIAEASRRSGVNIIATSGWWLDWPRFYDGLSPDQLASVFVREIEQGISGTNIKAGILKAAHDLGGVTSSGKVVLKAVARAHLRTGAPIVIHSYSPGQVGREQLAILKEEGVDLTRVKMDHSNDTTDVEYLIWLLDQGCFLGLDRYPGRLTSSKARTRTLKALIDLGFADRLCPSHDGIIIRVMGELPGLLPTEEERLKINPYGFLYMKKVVFPDLASLGVPEKIINNLCVIGPRKFLENK